MKTPKFIPLTDQESADVESAIDAIYQQSAKVPFKPFESLDYLLAAERAQKAGFHHLAKALIELYQRTTK
jgi:hypothetical protein